MDGITKQVAIRVLNVAVGELITTIEPSERDLLKIKNIVHSLRAMGIRVTWDMIDNKFISMED